MTLAIRFWPLTSHAGTERYFWTPGLDVFHRMLLRIMKVKELADITQEHLKMRIKEKWAPFLPRDREAEVNEWAVRASNTIASVEQLIEMASDVEDITEERQRILQWVKDVETAKQEAIAAATIEIQENQQEADAEMQTEQLDTQEKVAKTQAAAFQARPKPAAGGAKKPPQRGGA